MNDRIVYTLIRYKYFILHIVFLLNETTFFINWQSPCSKTLVLSFFNEIIAFFVLNKIREWVQKNRKLHYEINV